MSVESHLDGLLKAMAGRMQTLAIAEKRHAHSYADLLQSTYDADQLLDAHGIAEGDVVGLQAAFCLSSIALALCAFRRKAIVAFLSPTISNAEQVLAESFAVGFFIVNSDDEPQFRRLKGSGSHPLLAELRRRGHSGFVIFSSGSTGRPKAILHDLEQFLAAYDAAVKPLKTLAFLLLDHIAGLDTLFYTLHAGGALIITDDRSPAAICQLIDKWRAEVLPVSPSFLRLLCLAGVPENLDLSSLRIITYGSEPIDAETLRRVAAMFPNVKLRQKYGASEFGAPRSRTREGDGLWIQLDSRKAEVRVEDGVLWLRATTTMLGYLNVAASTVQDGWFCTGDRVEVDGSWMRVLGRDSDIINVGGEKVFPAEVEAVIRELDIVAEVAVYGEPHAILGQAVIATIRPSAIDVEADQFRKAVRIHCLARLPRYKMPIKIHCTDKSIISDRQKIVRNVNKK